MARFKLSAKVLALVFLFVVPGSGSLRSSRYQRKLEEFVIPFQISWRFEITDQTGAPEDRQPTEAEYEGINQATIDWYTVEIPAAYANQNFTFRVVDCTTVATSFDPASPEWQHQMTHQCEATFDSANMADLPTLPEFLIALNADYLLDDFERDHLRSVEPSSPPNIFRFADRIGYTTSESGTTGPGAAPTPTMVTPAPTITLTISTPAPIIVTSAPTLVTQAPVQTLTPTLMTQAPIMTPAPTVTLPMPTSPAPAPTMGGTGPLKQQKAAPPAKCGSLALDLGRGGAASQAKDCASGRNDRVRRKRKLKGDR
jgi:hypothetical protein